LLAWSLREGVTNVLRHSEADHCSITALRSNGTLRLSIVNDRAHPASGAGTGLAGLRERAREVSATVNAERGDDDEFRLLVEVPEVPP